MATLPISVQLYTLRNLTQTDMAGTLKEVARLGYKYVELAGNGNLGSAKDVRRALDDAGLKPSGGHVPIEVLEKDLNKAMDDAETVGSKYLVVPWMNEDRRRDAAGWKQVGAALTKIATAAKARGLEVAYHNHDFEFRTFDGQPALDLLFSSTDPALVKAELDVFWVKRGGHDPVAYLRKLSGRVPLVHLKDVAKGDATKFAEVGAGTLDFPAIVAAAVQAGAKFGIVEQDDTYGTPPLEAIKTSLDNLRKMGI